MNCKTKTMMPEEKLDHGSGHTLLPYRLWQDKTPKLTKPHTYCVCSYRTIYRQRICVHNHQHKCACSGGSLGLQGISPLVAASEGHTGRRSTADNPRRNCKRHLSQYLLAASNTRPVVGSLRDSPFRSWGSKPTYSLRSAMVASFLWTQCRFDRSCNLPPRMPSAVNQGIMCSFRMLVSDKCIETDPYAQIVYTHIPVVYDWYIHVADKAKLQN